MTPTALYSLNEAAFELVCELGGLNWETRAQICLALLEQLAEEDPLLLKGLMILWYQTESAAEEYQSDLCKVIEEVASSVG